MAVQIFFQFDFLNRKKNLDEIKEDLIENYALDFEEEICSYRGKIDENFLNNLLSGLTLAADEIDAEVSAFLNDGRNLEQIDEVARQILRLGTLELKAMLDIPARVVIDQYVDLAASFFDRKKVTFVNAVLDGLAKKLRKSEFEKNDQ